MFGDPCCPDCQKMTGSACRWHSIVTIPTGPVGFVHPANAPMGWKCPDCGRCFAPHVDECKKCGPSPDLFPSGVTFTLRAT